MYILNYQKNNDYILTSYGKLKNVEEDKIIHKCNTDYGSSGAPILLLKNNKVIGYHYGSIDKKIVILADYLKKHY